MYFLDLWKFIVRNIDNSQPVILLCVVDSKGSSPGRQGFKMAVSKTEIIGSIGGGIMEHKFVELAKEMLNDLSDGILLRKQLHNKSSERNQSGMICSGEQTIAILRITKVHYEEIVRLIISVENSQQGILTISPSTLIFSDNPGEILNYFFAMKNDNEWIYEERIGYQNHIYIIGGGHCALALSRLLSSMDFFITLIDDRQNLNTYDQNIFAHDKKIIPDYSSLADYIKPGKNVYVVIMTFGYRTDDLAFRAIINGEYKYLGILGSKAKMEKLFSEWRNDKLPEEALKKICAPIGLPINSKTPEEIAVSIAAEIIALKNRVI